MLIVVHWPLVKVPYLLRGTFVVTTTSCTVSNMIVLVNPDLMGYFALRVGFRSPPD